MERRRLAKDKATESRFDYSAASAQDDDVEVDESYHQSVIERYSQSIQHRPNDAHAWYYRGEAFANVGNYSEALTNFDQVLLLRPHDHETWIYRGVVLIHLERYAEALASCDRALEIQSNNREAWTFRGVALQRLERYKEAYASFACATGVTRPSRWRQLLQASVNQLKRLGFKSCLKSHIWELKLWFFR